MSVYLLDRDFDIRPLTLEKWPYAPHTHSFFELIYILQGTGQHTINHQTVPYHKGMIFAIKPGDTHQFHIDQPSHLCFITFHRIYFERHGDQELLQPVESVFYYLSLLEGQLLHSQEDTHFIELLIQRMLQETADKHSYHHLITRQSLAIILAILARQAQQHVALSTDQPAHETTIHQITTYIHQHIDDPDALKTEKIAALLNFSPNYVGQYFKRATGHTLRHYILTQRLNLVKWRLQFSTLTVEQIAAEMGFVDASHLNRLFKKRFAFTPTQYRHAAAGEAVSPSNS